MKRSLSLLIAASTAVVLIPLTFADSSSSVSSSSAASVSQSSTMSSAASAKPCDTKKGIDKVLCMAATAQKNKQVAVPKAGGNKVLDIISSCATTKGLAKLTCLRKVNKAVVKTMMKVEKNMMKVDNKIGKNVEGTMMNKPMIPAACGGKRGGELALCLQGLSAAKHSSMMSSSSSSEAN